VENPIRLGEYTAVIHAADGVRFTASAASAAERSSRILDYVIERCQYTLWPRAAGEVRARIAAGDVNGAIATYFADVGERWDEEWLELDGSDERQSMRLSAEAQPSSAEPRNDFDRLMRFPAPSA